MRCRTCKTDEAVYKQGHGGGFMKNMMAGLVPNSVEFESGFDIILHLMRLERKT